MRETLRWGGKIREKIRAEIRMQWNESVTRAHHLKESGGYRKPVTEKWLKLRLNFISIEFK